MRDPRFTAAWIENLTLRLYLGQTPTTATPASATKSDLPPTGSHTNDMPTDCGLTRSSARSLATLRSLSPCATILLLTPVVVPADPAKTIVAKDAMDPFEALGRALSQDHKRIRHVPYVPSVGLTDTHEIFLRQADAVIVVACEPRETPEEGTNDHATAEESIAKQSDLAESVVDVLDGVKVEARQVPLVLIKFGHDQWHNDLTAYENVLRGERYSPSIVKQLAQLLFRPPS